MSENQHLPKSILLEEMGSPVLIRMSIVFSFVLLLLFLGWASQAKVNEVAMAPGEIVPTTEAQKVQHISGGVVIEVKVKEGAVVEKGQALMTIYTPVARGQREYYEEAELRADMQGRVHKMKFKGRGEIIPAGETVMEIVPIDKFMVAQIRIKSEDIGHVEVGDEAVLKLDTFEFSRYGGMQSQIASISPTTFFDANGAPYYQANIELTQPYLGKNPQRNLILPGMTLVADIKTGQKTVLEYLLKPIFSSAKQALRER